MDTVDRLNLIPEQWRAHHIFCFAVHDRMLDVLNQCEAAQVANFQVTLSEADREDLDRSSNPIAFLVEKGRLDQARQIVARQVVIPLFADMLHFIHEALKALEKRKYTVALSLMRKAFKYDLLFAAWVVADEDDFTTRMASPADALDDRSITAERRKQILQQAASELGRPVVIDGGEIYALTFDRDDPESLAPLFDMAAHLVTSHRAYRTEGYNLNFIFKNPEEVDLYDGVYPRIAYLLLFVYMLELKAFGRMRPLPDWYDAWAESTTFGAYGSLQDPPMSAYLDVVLDVYESSFRCVVCLKRIAVLPAEAWKLFLNEVVTCGECGSEQQVPLFWLFSRGALPLDKASEPR